MSIAFGILVAATLVLSPRIASAGTELEIFEKALAKIAGDAYPGKQTKKKGLCVCNNGGAQDGRAGNLVSHPDPGDDSYFVVGCGVRQFDTTTGEQSTSSFCFPYIPVGR
jgi:hypothetical protein